MEFDFYLGLFIGIIITTLVSGVFSMCAIVLENGVK